MSYFVTLLQRSGVAVSHSGVTARNGASSAFRSPAAVDPVGHAAVLEHPTIRELHEERLLPSQDEGNERTSSRATPTNVHPTARSLDDSIEPRELPHATGDASVITQTGTFGREASANAGDGPDPGRRLVVDVARASEIAVGAQPRPLTEAPFELSPLGSRITRESPESSSDRRPDAMAQALAEVRKWTSQTSMPSELSLVDDYTRGSAETPAGIRSIEPPLNATRDSTFPELHVSIGSIEVVVEEAPAAPMPAARTVKSSPAAGANSSSRRLARHHLRG